MIQENLKRYSPGERVWRHRSLAWRQRGFNIERGVPARSHLFHFQADTGWQGFIDLEQWLTCEMPDVASLASASRKPEQLEILFSESNMPLSNLPEELTYTQLYGKGWINGKQLEAVWSYLTPQGRVWLSHFPDTLTINAPEGELSTDFIPVETDFHIGSSMVSCRLLKTVRQGDILLIADLQNRVVSGDYILGDFIRTEEGFMLDNNDEYDDELFEEADEMTMQPSLVPRDKIKVKLGFILQKSRLSIAELESFYKGMILPCRPDAEKNIIITANGKNIARGELVWLEDKVGVEITDIVAEDGDDAGE